jgi:ABC-type dipeptide/oligopeptide/nickel transport system permease subunit
VFKFIVGMAFGFMIGYPYGIYDTVLAQETDFSRLMDAMSKLKGMIE